jgi:trimeric autotransporter adhesin
MLRKLDQWTITLSAMLLVGALLACKKKTPAVTLPSAESAAANPAAPVVPAVPATAASPDVGAKLGDVKRYSDKETTQTGTARILEDAVKVFNEADDKTADVATLDKGLLVFRLASIPDWELVEFPSGVGKVSPGWVQSKFVDTKTDTKVERAAVAAQAKQAVVKTTGSAAPKTSAVASVAKPAASASASAKTTAAADQAAADKAAADAAAARAARIAARAAARAKAAADAAAAAK